MINVIRLDNYFESNNYYSVGHRLLLSILDIYTQNNLKCLLIYRYKLDKLKSGVFKFGCNSPDRISFNDISSNYIILFHVEVYEKNPIKIIELFNYCLEKNIDLFLCVRNQSYYSKNENIFWKEIESYLPDNIVEYNLDNNLENIRMEIERNIKLKCLFN